MTNPPSLGTTKVSKQNITKKNKNKFACTKTRKRRGNQAKGTKPPVFLKKSPKGKKCTNVSNHQRSSHGEHKRIIGAIYLF